MLTPQIKKLVPQFVLDLYGRGLLAWKQKQNRGKAIEEVFTEIYQESSWGGAQSDYCSGTGTTDGEVVSAYIEMIRAKSVEEGFLDRSFVDLGCGDFRVGQQLLPFCASYTGVDIVRPVIERNQNEHGSESVRFLHLNLVEDELPDGEVCFIRQVLQHLGNDEIASILKKLAKYRWVFITEHYPSDNPSIKPNLDKAHGGDIRAYYNSGVYLDAPPFELPPSQLEFVLEAPGTPLGNRKDKGVIRTYLYKPGA